MRSFDLTYADLIRARHDLAHRDWRKENMMRPIDMKAGNTYRVPAEGIFGDHGRVRLTHDPHYVRGLELVAVTGHWGGCRDPETRRLDPSRSTIRLLKREEG